MNIKYFAILVVVASLSLSGCTYRSLESGYDFEAQVIDSNGSPKLIVKCIPTQFMREIRITDDFLLSALKKLAGATQMNQPEDSSSGSAAMMNVGLNTSKGSPEVMLEVAKYYVERQESLTSLYDVLKNALKNGLLACPPGVSTSNTSTR